MEEILKLPQSQLKLHIKELAEDYYVNYGRRVCTSCPSDINNMLITLRKHYKMTNFEFKKLNGIYKMKQGGSVTISNKSMTDEIALEFLSINKERISLFSKYPENWEELLDNPTVEPKVDVEPIHLEETPIIQSDLRDELSKYKMQELREMYPDIKATSKEDFITLVLNED